jgi:hypothetical protein
VADDSEFTEKLNPESAGRFTWGDGDVQWLTEDGKPMTARQAKEEQLLYARSQVAEDVAADTQPEGKGQ